MKARPTTFAWLICVALVSTGCDSGEAIFEGPDELFVGRTATLTFANIGASFSPETPVALGEGIEVLARRTPTADWLEVDVQVDPRAPLGPRDAIVAGQILAEAMTLRSPLGLSVETLPRGYVGPIRFTSEDPSTSFEGSSPTFYASEGITLQVLEQSGAALGALIAIDPSAPLGPADLDIQLERDGESTRFVRLAALTITEAEESERLLPGANEVRSGAVNVGWLVPTGEASYFEIAPTQAVWVWAADAGGRFVSARPGASVRLLAEEPRAVAFFTTGRDAMVEITEWPVRIAQESASESIASAPTLGGPGVALRGLELARGPLFAAVDLVDGAVGKRLYVATVGAGAVDTRLALIADDRQTHFGPASVDDDYLDVLTSPVLTANGRYFVRIEAGSVFDSDSAPDSFDLIVVMR